MPMPISLSAAAMTDRPVRTADSWSAELAVDPAHPFYFDHPVDHVPGNLLVTALLQLVTDITDGPAEQQRVLMSLQFPRFAELDAPITLTAVPDAGGWHVQALQRARVVADGRIAVTVAHPPVTAAPTPVAAELVHRQDERSVMVGVFTEVHEAPLLPTGDAVRGPYEIVEAARQCCIMLGHLVYQHPDGSHTVWLRLEADLPAQLPGELPLALRWRQAPAGRARARIEYAYDVVGPAGSLGTIRLVMHTVTDEAYRKLRAAP